MNDYGCSSDRKCIDEVGGLVIPESNRKLIDYLGGDVISRSDSLHCIDMGQLDHNSPKSTDTEWI
jgi:hypothetical protein